MAKKYKLNRHFIYEGIKYSIHADTEEELAIKKAMKIRDFQENKVIINNSMTVKDWGTKCIEVYKTRQNEVTKQKYISRVNYCIFRHIGDMQLKNVKPLHCQDVMNLQIGKSKTQINEVYQALQFIFSKAVDNKLILSNPAKGITKPVGTHHPRRAITEFEREHIIKVAKTDRRYYLFLLMLYCGCRPSEAAECIGKDIQVIDGFNMLHIRGTKTKLSDRVVPIPNDLYELIKDTPPFEYIAQNTRGKKIDDRNRWRLWDGFKRRLNLSMGCKTYRNKLIPPFPVAPDLVPYCLRHTYCSDLARAGIDLRIAQKLMGHSDITLTANIYTHIQTDDIISAAQKLKGETLGETLTSGNSEIK